ncbi:hypothetical protein GCM10008959_05220 [Deinococcus seoulensis]|uniref:Uncharacterized protein n=2 Tax=Deinococcus TaxID=1298 RepID=A0ABQ2RLG2_9DEIO|nr:MULTISPECIES: hypothetical protein [Deinococcus]GGR47095.1 hypothetical protein GCM10008959_05220 [Deinococcus seoulensis]GGS15462.1 hypothetical protein GCM10008961_03560 [Deinococcus knuensis]
MNVPRHFSDTRLDAGRVRILTAAGRVRLEAEGPGWQHRSVHDTLEQATLELALLGRVSAELYAATLDDIERQVRRDAAYRYPGAA